MWIHREEGGRERNSASRRQLSEEKHCEPLVELILYTVMGALSIYVAKINRISMAYQFNCLLRFCPQHKLYSNNNTAVIYYKYNTRFSHTFIF